MLRLSLFLFLKRSNFTFILAQLGISDNQFPLKSCRDGKWGLPSLEMNFCLPDYFFYNELVNDPRAENVTDSSFSDHLTSFPFHQQQRTTWENILNGANGSRLQGPPQSHLWCTGQASEQSQEQSTFNWTYVGEQTPAPVNIPQLPLLNSSI